jgi:type 1 glutamine amidotransferase/glucose/arabinose dehydrogenase/mono/diheme cytochrome c family protein
VFTKTDTAGYRHASIPDGIEALRTLGEQHYFDVTATEDASMFTADRLSSYDAVVFLSTSGNVLNDEQQAAFEDYIRQGGGFVGIHGAAATEYDWTWYGNLVGAFFDDHPQVQEATVRVVDAEHPSTLHLPSPWTWTDEWYNFRSNPTDSVHVLLTVDEASYDGGTMGDDHPIAWRHEHDGGRSFYTGLGHTKESFAKEAFRTHLLEGIEWAAGELAPFVEPDNPFLTTTVDAGGLAPFMPERNVAVRAVAIKLGNGAYASFDPDLLRMSAGWTGDFVSMSTMAQVSYDRPNYKSNEIPRVLGRPVFGTGLYPGWAGGNPTFTDPRPRGPNPEDAGRGPLSDERGEWKGLYTAGDDVVLSYSVRGVDVREHPSSVQVEDEVGITRTFAVGATDEPLTLVASEVQGASSVERDRATALLTHGVASDSVMAVGGVGLPDGASFEVVNDRYITLRLAEGTPSSRFRLVLWTGPRSQRSNFRNMLDAPVEMPSVNEASEQWTRSVKTRGTVAPDTSAFVVDELSLPLPNPWGRNVRVADVGFFDDGRAAVVTFSGDVWLVSGIDDSLEQLRWTRYASGLYEPLSISVVDDQVYVYGREGIVRLRDVDDDGEADYYENYSNDIIQSMETREWPLDMVSRPGGGFYLSMGAALNAGPRSPATEEAAPGFRVGSRHAGTVTEVLPGGDSVRVYADGLREPYLGAQSEHRVLTASDQQGNFVPSTPIYAVQDGDYYGVPATTQRPTPLPGPAPPLTWIPHQVDPSGAGQLWVNSEQMGPLNDKLLHFSYSRPGPFRVYADTTATPWQGGVMPIGGDLTGPTSKGVVHPQDGQVYMGGFQVWGTTAEKVSSLLRLRYTGQPSMRPAMVRGGQQGVLLRFAQPLDSTAATLPGSYAVRRWEYRRTEQYGSGRYTLDGTPGEEQLPVADVHLSDDRQSVLVVVPDMRPVMQLQVEYSITTAEGQPLNGPVYLTVNEVRPIDLAPHGLGDVDWQADLEKGGTLQVRAGESEADTLVSAKRGRHLYQEVGCGTCHSLDGSDNVGPSFRGLYETGRDLKSGERVVADRAYLRQSILNPRADVVEGYMANMPSYEGRLRASEVHSLIAFIRSLGAERKE